MTGNTVYARNGRHLPNSLFPSSPESACRFGKKDGFSHPGSFRLRFCRLNAAPENPSFAGKRERAGRVGTGACLPDREFPHKPEAAFSGKLMYHR